MSAFVQATVESIDQRLAELGEERHKLEAARAALVGGRAETRAASAAKPAPSRGRGRPRGSGSRNGSRATQALARIRESPGITIPELADKLGLKPNYLYRVVPSLISDGLVTKTGTGLTATAEAATKK